MCGDRFILNGKDGHGRGTVKTRLAVQRAVQTGVVQVKSEDKRKPERYTRILFHRCVYIGDSVPDGAVKDMFDKPACKKFRFSQQ